MEPGLKPYLRGGGGAAHGGGLQCDFGSAGGGGWGWEGVWGHARAPAKPEEEGADELERGRVPVEVPGAFEAASPRAEDLCAHLVKVGARVMARNDGLGWGLEELAECRGLE